MLTLSTNWRASAPPGDEVNPVFAVKQGHREGEALDPESASAERHGKAEVFSLPAN